MLHQHIEFCALTHNSPEFDAAYNVIAYDIAPEFLETKEFLRNRLRVRDEGAKSIQENTLLQEGYSLHLIAAKKDSKVVGAIYGHLIALKNAANRGIGFVTYISVLPDYRKCGIGAKLVEELKNHIDRDAIRTTGRPIVGMVFEIEDDGKEAIKGLVRKHQGWPLDIVYFQPALRAGYQPEQMRLWLQSFEPGITTVEEASRTRFRAEFVTAIVRNMLVMEYVGPEMKGFDLSSKPYTAFLDSIDGRNEIGFILTETT